MLKLKNKDFDIYLTKLANKLSEINRHNTFPNPSVGAVILKKNGSFGALVLLQRAFTYLVALVVEKPC